MALNKIILQGNICRDVQLSNTNNGGTYLRNTIAVSRNYVKEGEERQSDFISILAYGKTAEHISKYFQKGSQILIEGELRAGSYDKEDGTKVYTTDVICNQVYFVGQKKDNNTSSQTTTSSTNELPTITTFNDELPF